MPLIREGGASPGIVFNPATPLTVLDEVIDLVDLVLIMSVNPGFGGQAFIESSLDKLAIAREIIDDARRDTAPLPREPTRLNQRKAFGKGEPARVVCADEAF